MFPVPQLPTEEPQISLTVPPPVEEDTIVLVAPVDPVEQAELVEQVVRLAISPRAMLSVWEIKTHVNQIQSTSRWVTQ